MPEAMQGGGEEGCVVGSQETERANPLSAVWRALGTRAPGGRSGEPHLLAGPCCPELFWRALQIDLDPRCSEVVAPLCPC